MNSVSVKLLHSTEPGHSQPVVESSLGGREVPSNGELFKLYPSFAFGDFQRLQFVRTQAARMCEVAVQAKRMCVLMKAAAADVLFGLSLT